MTDLFTPGQMFGDYRVVRRLGKGGMGEVWQVEIESRHQSFAVKLLDPDLVAKDREFRKRFLREAELAMAVRHPNCISVYDVGEDPDTGYCYIIMEYVGGGSLSDRIERGGMMSVEDALAVVACVGDALECFRQNGVVHRDVKPDNILFDDEGNPKLSDLGIARRSNSVNASLLTMPGFIVGTPAYMAPEQMLDSHNVDCRADIYSLGLVLYEMLTGACPNGDSEAMEIMARTLKGMSVPDVRTVRKDVPDPVARLIAKMCETKASKRFETPADVVAAVEAIQSGENPFAPTKEQVSKLGKRRRHKRLLILGGLLAVLFIVVDFVAWWFFLREKPVRPQERSTVRPIEWPIERPIEKPVEKPTVLPTVKPKERQEESIIYIPEEV